MIDNSRLLEKRMTEAWDGYNDLVSDDSMAPSDMIRQMTPHNLEIHIAQWAASLDIRTKHTLWRSCISEIR